MTRLTFLTLGILFTLVLGTGDARAQGTADSTLAIPADWSTFYVVMLNEGPATLPPDSLQAVMNRHIQYQLRLQHSGQALVGGGFGVAIDSAVGMTILRSQTQEEAERLAREDPAVEAGRFIAVVRPWYVPAGRLPEQD